MLVAKPRFNIVPVIDYIQPRRAASDIYSNELILDIRGVNHLLGFMVREWTDAHVDDLSIMDVKLVPPKVQHAVQSNAKPEEEWQGPMPIQMQRRVALVSTLALETHLSGILHHK